MTCINKDLYMHQQTARNLRAGTGTNGVYVPSSKMTPISLLYEIDFDVFQSLKGFKDVEGRVQETTI